MLNAIPDSASWEPQSLPLLIERLAAACGVRQPAATGEPPAAEDDVADWIETSCSRLEMDARVCHVPVRDVEPALVTTAPALLRLSDGRFLGVIDAHGRCARLATTDSRSIELPLTVVRDALCGAAEAPFAADVQRLVDACAIGAARQDRARRAILRERAGSRTVALGWRLRRSARSSFVQQLRHGGAVGAACAFACAYALEYALTLGSWWLLASAALNGRIEAAWLAAWALTMSGALVCRSWKATSSESLALIFGGHVKQRLLAGAVRVDPDAIRRQGIGATLGRVMEAEALESLSLGGALAALVAPLELITAGVLLWLGAAGFVHVVLLAAWVATLTTVVLRNQRLRAAWTRARQTLTEDLVERMHGHRTRVAQEDPRTWHAAEDRLLDAYLDRSTALDRSDVHLQTLIPRLWLLIGLAALAPAFARAAAPSSLAVSIAAVMLAHRALRGLGLGLADLGGAALAWTNLRPLFAAACERVQHGAESVPTRDRQPVLDARDLSFQYGGRGERVLRRCSMTIRDGDRILIEGASGSGKSTFAALLAGLRSPDAGVLLAGGVDRQSLGDDRWRRRVAFAPQSHENHIFAGSLAFNLLMGHSWPPTPEQLARAQTICEEIGLDDLISRMPAGLNQQVGDAGWRLSEGERSRVFLARALLSGADLLVLDESFSALDPETLERAHRAVHRRAPAVVMIAHR
ncbi:MAG TPA: ATP-binding cassette domain-containing protein [Vicinamibacterales bacterium]|nr:ATP-binding cassette domain-containing protein [Vicinamibacterales bacterium]